MSPHQQNITDVARNFCELVDRLQDGDEKWLQEVASLLPRLHAAVSSIEQPDEDDGHYVFADLDARFELYSYLRQLLGERDGYWMEFDVAEDGQSMSGSLADDLTDIYCELKHGLKVMEGEPDQAIEGWRKGYHLHWGQHLVDAERHLYELKARNQLNL
ncbi:MAG: DUF5063 domain-containing protein [gamma proteobacterium endosymbiont of Lamellibrachia anaximandri]|nr:DUF5063 domain-containing protein [gamma proteobacterium endosymbiont of Lamellibrachia anaximandri]MBL3616247.1 DUF5063 domain-containing protein [gamma proteobacterium endosymbiont of Lamellibrachia anaximandri]